MMQGVRRDLLDVADDVGGGQVPAAVLAAQVVEDLFRAQVKAGAEHLLAGLHAAAAAELTDLQVVLQRHDLLLLLLQDAAEGFHMLERELQHHGLLQM
uniref:Uncharacterized protein n=1 Tax=Gasterosteus aculeatus TaxID=69293 RepID=G3PDZ7_GASAC